MILSSKKDDGKKKLSQRDDKEKLSYRDDGKKIVS